MHNSPLPASPLTPRTPDYYHLTHTLITGLPPPVADTPEALAARNTAAIEKVAAMLPANAIEADIAALYVATRAQADDAMRLLRVHDGDIKTAMKLNAQYFSMVRTSLSAHGRLMRVQALRHKREASDAARAAAELEQRIAASCIRQLLDAGPAPAVPTANQAPLALSNNPPPARSAAPVARAPAPGRTQAPPPSAAVKPPPPPPHVVADAAEAPAQPRDLQAEADQYALVYPYRARNIRRHRGLPPNCSYGPPDADLVAAIVTGATPALRALDAPIAATG